MTGVNDLPTEVLGYTFILASLENLSPPSWRLGGKKYLRLFSGESHRNRAPFVFLQVCRHWRAVAEATSLLWTSLDATMHEAFTRTSPSITAMEHWLSLSHSAPLDFVLETENSALAPDARKELSSAHAAAMLRVVTNDAHRWQSASFHTNHHLTGVLVDVLLNQPSHSSFSSLKRLDIDIRPRDVPNPVDDLARAIGSIESLSELYLAMHPGYVPSLLRDIHWGQLTTVYLHMPLTPGQVASFLAQSTAAITATFTFITDSVDDLYNDMQHCTLSELKILTLLGTENLLRIFHRIHFPCLEQLYLRSSSHTCYQILQRLMDQTNLTIRRLLLWASYQFSESDLADCLRITRLGQVPHVEFHCVDVLEIVAKALPQLKDEVLVLLSWNSAILTGYQCIGWKPYFDETDGQVTHITPAPDTSTY